MERERLTILRWRRSSYSGSNANCVEVAVLADGLAVRDSKHPHGGDLAVPVTACHAFVAAATH